MNFNEKEVSCLFLLIIFIYSCNPDYNKNSVKLSSQTDTLFSKTITTSVDVLMPMKDFIIDDKIFIIDNTKDKIVKIFQLPHYKYLFSWGKLGRGPAEFNYIDQGTIMVRGNIFEFLDFQKLRTYKVEESKIIEISTKVVPNLGSPINGLKRINDSVYIANTPLNTGDLEQIIININSGKIIKRFGKFPRYKEIKNRTDRDRAYHRSSTSSPNGEKYAVFYTNFNTFKIYNSGGNLLKEIEIKSENPKEYSLKDGKRNIIYNAEPWSSDSVIYVLNVNKSVVDIEKYYQNYNPYLYIWNWEGKLISYYLLDQPITSFVVSEKFRKLYGISYLKMNEIYEFNLPDSLFHINNKYTFTEIENDFYKAKMIKGWIQTTPESERNRLTQVNELTYNTCIFYDPKKKDVSLWINVIPKIIPNFSSESYFKKYREPMLRSNKEHIFYIDTINLKKTYFSSFSYESTDPLGKRFSNIDANWIWEDNDKIFELKYYSFENFEYYLNGVQEILSSISAKILP